MPATPRANNVRFAPPCGLKSDITRGPRSAISGRERMQRRAHPNSLDHLGSILVASVAQSYKLGLALVGKMRVRSLQFRHGTLPAQPRDAARFMSMEYL